MFYVIRNKQNGKHYLTSEINPVTDHVEEACETKADAEEALDFFMEYDPIDQVDEDAYLWNHEH
jgi:hypothetical protein